MIYTEIKGYWTIFKKDGYQFFLKHHIFDHLDVICKQQRHFLFIAATKHCKYVYQTTCLPYW